MVAPMDALHEEEYDESTYQYQHHHDEDDARDEACRALTTQGEMHLVHRLGLMVALYEESGILYAVHLLHIHHAVAHGLCHLVCRQRGAVFALALVYLII